MSNNCSSCGYRVNPDTAKNAGLVSSIDPFLHDYCYISHGFVSRKLNCPDWISYEEVDYEKKFFQQASRRR